MGFIFNTSFFLIFIVAITLFKIIAPEESYKKKTSLIIGVTATFTFALIFLLSIKNFSGISFWAIVYCLISCFYLYSGSKEVYHMTITGVFSRVTNKLVGNMRSGIGWADPIYERVTTSINGVNYESIDLQELEIEISETSLMQTKTTGRLVKIKNVVFMLDIIEDKIPQLFEIEGGKETIKDRILSYINYFLLDEVGKIDAVDLDKDKGDTLKELSTKLKASVNLFCEEEDYPFQIPYHSSVTIGDIELEQKYLEALVKKENARLEQDALDTEAERIRDRLVNLGKELLPEGSENEKLQAAMVALKITPKSIEEKTLGVSPEIKNLFIELANILIQKNK